MNIIKLSFILIHLNLLGSAILNAQSHQEWVSVYSLGYDLPYSMTIIPNTGNIVIAGAADAGVVAASSYFAICYNPLGVQQWASGFISPNSEASNSARSICMANNSDAIATGYSRLLGESTITTVRYDANGNLVWRLLYGNRSVGNSISVNQSWITYCVVSGESRHNINASSDYITILYDLNGGIFWVQSYDGPSNGSDVAVSNVFSTSGFDHAIYVTGKSFDSTANFDYATIKYNLNGDEAWVRRYNGTGNGIDQAVKVCTDPFGNAYVTGNSLGNSSGYDIATIKYNSSGTIQWVQRFNGTGNGTDSVTAMAVDYDGNVFVTGYSSGNGTGFDLSTIKYNTDGNVAWMQSYSGPADGRDGASAIALDGLGNVFVTGNSMGAGSGKDFITIKYTSDGNEAWVQRYNGQANNDDIATCIAVDNTQNVYISGSSTAALGLTLTTVKYSQGPTYVSTSGNEIPEHFSLHQNFPNPFNPVTRIRFELPESINTVLSVYDISGKEVKNLVNEFKNAVSYEVAFDASEYSGGIYFFTLVADGKFIDAKSMILLK